MTKNWAWLYIILVGLTHHTIASNQIDRDIEKQLALPESQNDVGIAALTFAKEIYPNLDVAAYSKKIDLIAANTKLFIDKQGGRL